MSVWLNLWLVWLLRLAEPSRGAPAQLPLLTAGLVLAGTGATRYSLKRRDWSTRQARAVVGGTGALALALSVLLAFPARVAALDWYLWPNLGALLVTAGPTFLAGLYAWRYGIHLGRIAIGHYTLSTAFYTGVLALALLLLCNSLRPVFTGAEVLPPLLSFFALGLCGLALSSLRRLRAQQRSVTVTQGSLTRYWLLTTLLVIGVLVVVGVATAQLLLPETVALLADAASAIFYLILLSLALVISPIGLLIATWLAPFFFRMMAGLRALLSAVERLAAVVMGLLSALGGAASKHLPDWLSIEQLERFIHSPAVQISGRWLLVLLALLAAGVAAALALRRLSALIPVSEDEQRDSIFSPQLLWAQLRQLFRRRRRAVPSLPRYLPLLGPHDDARLIVRRSYQGMLEWAQSISLPRAAGQTPRAYADLLAGAVPQGQDAIRALTSAYLLARYAPEAPSLDEARRVEGAMTRLRSITPEGAGRT